MQPQQLTEDFKEVEGEGFDIRIVKSPRSSEIQMSVTVKPVRSRHSDDVDPLTPQRPIGMATYCNGIKSSNVPTGTQFTITVTLGGTASPSQNVALSYSIYNYNAKNQYCISSSSDGSTPPPSQITVASGSSTGSVTAYAVVEPDNSQPIEITATTAGSAIHMYVTIT